MTNVIVLNANYQYLDTVHWTKAARLLVIGRAEGVEVQDGKFMPSKIVRTVTQEFIIPMVIKLKEYVKKVFKVHVPWKKHNVYIRDKYECQYCGVSVDSKTATIDHVVPKSRGGKNTFENTVTSCYDCNQKKGDRKPDEAKMFLKRRPFQPTIAELLNMSTQVKGIKATLQGLGLA